VEHLTGLHSESSLVRKYHVWVENDIVNISVIITTEKSFIVQAPALVFTMLLIQLFNSYGRVNVLTSEFLMKGKVQYG
jgi:hypothetical protein